MKNKMISYYDLLTLWKYTTKLITDFNCLKNKANQHIEEVSHDTRNLNSSIQEKEEIANSINESIELLSSKIKLLVKFTNQEIKNCKTQLKSIQEKSKAIDSRYSKRNESKSESEIKIDKTQSLKDKKSKKQKKYQESNEEEHDGKKNNSKKNEENKESDKSKRKLKDNEESNESDKQLKDDNNDNNDDEE